MISPSLLFRRRALPLRVTLLLSFAAVSLVAAAIISAMQIMVTSRQMRGDLREKAVHYGRLLQRQLEPVVAFDDRLTAREVLDSFAADADVDGLAVYSASGELIEGCGNHPETLLPSASLAAVPGDQVISTGAISTREGPRGQVFVSLTTLGVQRELLRRLWTSIGLSLAGLLVALFLAHLVTRALTRRLTQIAGVARRIANGDFEQPALPCAIKDEIGALAHAFNVMVSELTRLFEERRQLARTEQARLESLVSTRTQELEESREQYRLIAESTNAIPFTLDLARGAFTYVGPQAMALLGFSESAWKQPGFLDTLLPRERAPELRKQFDQCGTGSFEIECQVVTPDARDVVLRWVVSAKSVQGTSTLCGLMLDVTARRRLESELNQAQKLESVGRLAAGVAHEINTPIQFVSDSVTFVRDSLHELTDLIEKYRLVKQAVLAGTPAEDAAAQASSAEEASDLPYLVENLPKALDRSLEGLERVTTIVRSMKAFAHPDQKEMSAVDLNQAIQSTLTIARNEYKYVADLETDFGEIPSVMCHGGDVNQAVLNIIVNAAHAIEDVVKGSDRRGRITVRTKRDGDDVVITIGDTGKGIPEEIRGRIFDPFFTTKEVGRGTGQGLAIARGVVMEKHGGTLTFDSEVGRGTTFLIRLPIEGHARAMVEAIA